MKSCLTSTLVVAVVLPLMAIFAQRALFEGLDAPELDHGKGRYVREMDPE